MRIHPDWFMVVVVTVLKVLSSQVIIKREIDTLMIHMKGKPAQVFGIVMLVLMLMALALEFRTL
jgi:predicted sugar kinase